jgi:hypothetical protein
MNQKTINKKHYYVKPTEFNVTPNETFCNLRIINEVGYFEKIISLINELKLTFNSDSLFVYNTNHGGFLPINCVNNFSNIYLLNTETENSNNINKNLDYYNIKNISFLNLVDNINTCSIVVNLSNIDIDEILYNIKNIIISTNKLNLDNYKCYKWDQMNINVYVHNQFDQQFINNFYYYIKESNVLFYDNLNKLCIMVKNGGPQFEQMLLDNIEQFDRWTILDTGSTDDTINIINRVLVGKKKGELYQEPFINFRDSRNRLLDLAGTDCKFLTTLDDTYVLNGNLRKFLNEVRGDQYSNSFSIIINSDDSSYGSNRIIKSDEDLRYIYKIHEVITDKNNINVMIPSEICNITDRRFDYMEARTIERKQLDLKLLFEELEEDPNNARTYYYLAQTYNLLGDYQKAFFYFNKRYNFINSGFLQERVDAAFEAARLANFKLNKPWDECFQLYQRAYKIDESRPESLYFMGIHYYLENNYKEAYTYFKKGFEVGFPLHCQYSLKPTLSFHFLPMFLTKTCYFVEDYKLGETSAEFFLKHNNQLADGYQEVLSWYLIFKKLNMYDGKKVPYVPDKPIICFVADGGFNPWTGSNILTTGVGGSETFIIEMARHIKLITNNYDVYVFCNTPDEKTEDFEGVTYMHLNDYYKFVNTTYIHTCIVSRFSEYLPVTLKGFTENVYFIIHDLTPSGIIIPKDPKLKNIFCLTNWHVEYFTNIFPIFKDITVAFNYGINNLFKVKNKQPVKNKFIYSSYPNRGLLQLLQMWPQIYEREPTATLHIYSDINNKWSNDVEPDKMQAIKNLLNKYKTMKNKLGIYYYGWVNKTELANAWSTADIWFYPCTFMETFCLTALEAASSKTLCITNDLAALQDTVGNRGVIVKGDPTTEEWQQAALNKVFYYMNNNNEKQQIINMNYDWANSLSWEHQSILFYEKYVVSNNLEYKGMYNWTNDIPIGSKQIFLNMIEHFNNNYLKVKFNNKIKILEIGTYTGTSLIELVKLIPNSTGIAVDKWSSYNENDLLKVVDNYKIKESFYKNIKKAMLEDKIMGIQIESTTALLEYIKLDSKFDFIYIDGSHMLLDCYTDLVLAWQILDKKGVLVIDDYLYNRGDLLNSPYEAVNYFLKLFQDQYKVLNIDYRVFLEKL